MGLLNHFSDSTIKLTVFSLLFVLFLCWVPSPESQCELVSLTPAFISSFPPYLLLYFPRRLITMALAVDFRLQQCFHAVRWLLSAIRLPPDLKWPNFDPNLLIIQILMLLLLLASALLTLTTFIYLTVQHYLCIVYSFCCLGCFLCTR